MFSKYSTAIDFGGDLRRRAAASLLRTIEATAAADSGRFAGSFCSSCWMIARRLGGTSGRWSSTGVGS